MYKLLWHFCHFLNSIFERGYLSDILRINDDKKLHTTNAFTLRDLEPRDNRSSRFKVMSQKVGWLFEDHHFWQGSQFQKFWSPDFGHKMDETSGFYGSNQKTIHPNHQIKWQNEDFRIPSDIVRIILEILVIFTLTTAQFYKKNVGRYFTKNCTSIHIYTSPPLSNLVKLCDQLRITSQWITVYEVKKSILRTRS